MLLFVNIRIFFAVILAKKLHQIHGNYFANAKNFPRKLWNSYLMKYYTKNPRLWLKKLKINVSYALLKLMLGNKKVMKCIRRNTKAGMEDKVAPDQQQNSTCISPPQGSQL